MSAGPGARSPARVSGLIDPHEQRDYQETIESLISMRNMQETRHMGTIKLMRHVHAALLMIAFLFISNETDAKIPDIVLKQGVAAVTVYVNSADKAENVTGSGFVIETSGVIATNYHVISKWLDDWDSSIVVKMENGTYLPIENVLAVDEWADIALIKAKAKNLTSVKLSPAYVPRQGEDIYTIGSPKGLESTVSNGIVSSVRQKNGLIQITAPISPGSSGSPVPYSTTAVRSLELQRSSLETDKT